MNGKRAKALRRAVVHLPEAVLPRFGVSLTGKIVSTTTSLMPFRPLTAQYPAGSRRRVYQDSKRG